MFLDSYEVRQSKGLSSQKENYSEGDAEAILSSSSDGSAEIWSEADASSPDISSSEEADAPEEEHGNSPQTCFR